MAPVIRIRTEAGETSMDLDEFEVRVRRGELAGHCLVQFTPLTGEAFVRADELELFRKLFRPKALYFARAFNLNRFPRITAAVVAVDIAVYLAMTLYGPIDQDALVAWGARVGPLIFDLGETWRLLTANFLHQGVLHIAFNLFVLFNVGGALENAYRPLDYAVLLLSSALGTTLVSLWALPDAMTVGASGVVYGTFGAAVVFGIKYRELLPKRYRSVLGEANVPTVLAFLYIGFTSTGVDNWAHVGGLVTGAATALGLEPRLLAEGKPSRRRRLLLVAPLVLGVGLAALGAWVAVRGPRMQTVADDGMGLRLEVPRSWVKGTERFGQLAFHNGLVGVGRASFSVQTQPRGDRTLDEVVQAYVQRTLVPEERAGALRDIVVHPARVERLAGREGRLLEATYSEEGGGTRMQAHFLQRGEQVYELVYAWSERYPRYEAVIGASTASVALVEPGVLRELRAQALLAPSTATLTELGSMLAVVGEQEGAVAAFSWAVEQQPEEGEAHVKLAGALLGAGRVEEACRAAEAGVGFLPEDPAALSTMSDCKRAQGDKLGALRYLRRALEAAPRDEALKAKLEALQ